MGQPHRPPRHGTPSSHAFPHEPQFFVFLKRSTSQPSSTSPLQLLQSSKSSPPLFLRHWTVQALFTQREVMWMGPYSAHAFPQAPQLSLSRERSIPHLYEG